MKEKRKFFFWYTVLFAVSAFFVFSWYFLAGRTLIWQADGWTQHYKALVYYARYMRDAVRGLMAGEGLVLPAWDFSIGEGSDIIGTMHYYAIGDPFTVFSVLVPAKFLPVYYNVSVLLRLYSAGAAFSLLCFKTGMKSRFAVMAGALSYTFCYWAIYNAGRHPFFLNPMIYFPLLILGIEKIIRKERPFAYMAAVCIAAVSNFYFFYMLVLLTVIYVAIRLAVSYRKDRKEGLRIFLYISGASVFGVLMGAVLFLPVCYMFLSDSRLSAGSTVHLFYPLSYYGQLPSAFLAAAEPYWMCMGYTAPVLLAVFLMFCRKKEYRLLKALFITGVIFMMFPCFGYALNGFSYMANRWSWAFALPAAYILAVMWPSLMALRRKEAVTLVLCTAGYFLLCMMLEYSRNAKTFAAIIPALFFLLLIFPYEGMEEERGGVKLRRKQILAMAVVFVSVLNISFWKNAAAAGNYAAEGKEAVRVRKELTQNDAAAVRKVAKAEGVDSFYRYSGMSLQRNVNVLSGISTTQYYWSLSNPYIALFRSEMGVREPGVFNYEGYDDRTALLALAAVRYYAVPSGDSAPVPYGFSYVDKINVKESETKETLERLKEELGTEKITEEQEKRVRNATQSWFSVYRNEHALPFAYTYGSWIGAEEWKALHAVGKQEAMLQCVYLEGYEGMLEKGKPSLTGEDIDYTLSCNGTGITRQGNTFVVTKSNSSVTLEFEGLPDCETYFSVEGLSFRGIPEYMLYFGEEEADPLQLYNRTDWELLSFKDKEAKRKEMIFWKQPGQTDLSVKASSGVAKTLKYYTEENNVYSNRHDFTINMDYQENPVTSLTVTFSNIGTYSFDSIHVYCQPMENYARQINALQEDAWTELSVGTDMVRGEISLDTEKMVCFSVPYSAGWRAYVDGKETQLYQANIMHMAVEVPAGEHTVLLVYKTPFLRLGFWITIGSFTVFLVWGGLSCYGKQSSVWRRAKTLRG